MTQPPEPSFHGSKAALLCGDELLVYLRDDKDSISFPNMWDLPGGGREGDETGLQCTIREVQEEFGFTLGPGQLRPAGDYPNWRGGGSRALFFVADITPQQIDSIKFGDEGQHWQMMKITDFLEHSQAVPHLQVRVRDVLQL